MKEKSSFSKASSFIDELERMKSKFEYISQELDYIKTNGKVNIFSGGFHPKRSWYLYSSKDGEVINKDMSPDIIQSIIVYYEKYLKWLDSEIKNRTSVCITFEKLIDNHFKKPTGA